MADVYEKIGGLKMAQPPESSTQSIIRNVSRAGARGAETFMGLPHDIGQGVLGLTNLGIEKATGQESPLPKDFPGAGAEWYRENITKPLTGDYLEPQGNVEKGIDDVVSDFVSLMVPIGPKLGVARSLAAAGIGNAASWITKGFGGSEGSQTGAKIGGMLLASAVKPRLLRTQIKDLYANAEKSIPANASTAANRIENQISSVKKILKHGDMTPKKKFLAERVASLENKINQDGLIPVRDVWAFKRDFNDFIATRGGAEELKGVEKYLTPFIKTLNDTMHDYGKVNPKFNYKAITQADDIWRGINTHSKVKSFLRNTVTIKNLIVGGLFGMSHPHILSKGIGAAAALRGAVEGLEPIFKSNEIKKQYLKTLGSAVIKDKNATLRNMANLERVVEREYPESKSSGMYEKIQLPNP